MKKEFLLELLKECLNEYETGGKFIHSGICLCIAHLVHRNTKYDGLDHDSIKFLQKFRPFKFTGYNSIYWFPKGKIEPRIKLLKKAIIYLEKSIKKTASISFK